DTGDAYRQFLAQHPNGKWAQEARIRIENFSLGAQPATRAAPGPPPPDLAQPAPQPPQQPVPPATAAMPTSAADSGGSAGLGVQLGAFGSEAAANDEWRLLAARFGSELHGLVPYLVAANTA